MQISQKEWMSLYTWAKVRIGDSTSSPDMLHIKRQFTVSGVKDLFWKISDGFALFLSWNFLFGYCYTKVFKYLVKFNDGFEMRCTEQGIPRTNESLHQGWSTSPPSRGWNLRTWHARKKKKRSTWREISIFEARGLKKFAMASPCYF